MFSDLFSHLAFGKYQVLVLGPLPKSQKRRSQAGRRRVRLRRLGRTDVAFGTFFIWEILGFKQIWIRIRVWIRVGFGSLEF